MTMQFVHSVKKTLGKQITIEDLRTHNTISHLADLIDSRSNISNSGQRGTRNGAPRAVNMAQAGGDETLAEKIKQSVQEVIQPMGLSWEDVEDVCPAYDFGRVMLRRLRPQSWNHRHAYATSQTNSHELRVALEVCLKYPPMLRSVGVQLVGGVQESSQAHETMESTTVKPSYGGDLLTNGTSVYVIVWPSKRWFDLSITEDFEVEKPEELATLVFNDPVLDLEPTLAL